MEARFEDLYPYALYKGDDFIMLGTLEDFSQRTGVKKETLKWYSTPSQLKRNKKTGYIVIRLDKKKAD